MKKEKVFKYEELAAMMPKPIFFDLTPEGIRKTSAEDDKVGGISEPSDYNPFRVG